MSAGMPVSRSTVRAALAVGVTANTARPCAWRSAAAAVSILVLPAPAGPTTSTSRSPPATAAAAAACNGSRPSPMIVVDGVGGSAWAPMAHVRIDSSWARTASDVNRGAVGSIHTERPSDWRRVVWPGGSRSTSWSRTWSVARSRVAAQRCPDCCVTGRCRSQIACRTSARVHEERCCDTAVDDVGDDERVGRLELGGGGFVDAGVEQVGGPAGVGGFGLPPCRQIGVRRCRTCATVCQRMLHGSSRPVPTVSARGLRVVRNSSSLSASAWSMSAERFENTARSSSGTPAISA